MLHCVRPSRHINIVYLCRDFGIIRQDLSEDAIINLIYKENDMKRKRMEIIDKLFFYKDFYKYIFNIIVSLMTFVFEHLAF